jgi:sialic acid synthase SpsE
LGRLRVEYKKIKIMKNLPYIICETACAHDGFVNNLKQLIKKGINSVDNIKKIINKKINRSIEEDQQIDASFLKNV